jgi:hypothetical protein
LLLEKRLWLQAERELNQGRFLNLHQKQYNTAAVCDDGLFDQTTVTISVPHTASATNGWCSAANGWRCALARAFAPCHLTKRIVGCCK